MIDTKAIRKWAQLCERQEDVIELNPKTVIALLDRLEVAEKEIQLVRNETLEWTAGLCDDSCQEQIRSLKS